jgi:MFS transporter, PPP family, 3-phenylpropionic acid transporter
MKLEKHTKYLFMFILFYTFSYMCLSVYGSFLPLYLKSTGFNQTQIGMLTSLAPIVAILVQPMWGTVSDRSKTKNRVLILVIIGSTSSILFYRLSTSFIYLAFIITVFTFFQTAINPTTDSITLESCQKHRWKFGHIRLAGTIGFCIMAVIAGRLLSESIGRMFVIYFVMGLVTLTCAFLLPKVKGYQSKGKKVFIFSLLKNRTLFMYISLALMIQITLGFFTTFFSIHYQMLGADRGLIGWAFFISGMSEIPFLLYAHKILKKVKTHHALLFAGAAAGLRWFLMAITSSIYLILVFQLLHGLIYIIIMMSMATYINETAPNELKASGQALNAIVGTGISRVIGSFFGGYLSDIFGIQKMFLYNSIFVLSAVVIFAFLFRRMNKVNNSSGYPSSSVKL